MLSTSAVAEYKRLHPDTKIVYRTYTPGRRPLQYALGSPSQMLENNPSIYKVIDAADVYTPEEPFAEVEFRYAWFGGPSLDYPIQAHYWENLDLRWQSGQRFDAHYYETPGELQAAKKLIGSGPSLVLTPGGGWPGKGWTTEGWQAVAAWAVDNGIQPIILAGERLDAPGLFGRGILNLAGRTDIRQMGAILAQAEYAVMTEGGPSNLRFALQRPAILLTCATQVGVQIWTPPELTTEIRTWLEEPDKDHPEIGGAPGCDPCMWRRDHVKTRSAAVPPASIAQCPPGLSLRDIPPEYVIKQLQRQIENGAHA